MPSGGLKFLKEASRKENLKIMLGCLLVAFSVWFMYNLSHDYSDIVGVEVRAVSNLEGRSEKSSVPVLVEARVRTRGYEMLKSRVSGRRKVREIYISPDDFTFVSDDTYSIRQAELSAYVGDMFGKEVVLESFISSSVEFRFEKQIFKKVPVFAVQSLSFRPQYMTKSGLKVSPDSVLVYGEKNFTNNVDRIYTRSITLQNIDSKRSGTIGLDAPAGVRLSVNHVDYSVDAVRFVEVRKPVQIVARGLPVGKSLSIFPSEAEAVFCLEFPVRDKIENNVTFYIDYEDFLGSRTGKCVARNSALPQGVVDVRLAPEVFECVENEFK